MSLRIRCCRTILPKASPLRAAQAQPLFQEASLWAPCSGSSLRGSLCCSRGVGGCTREEGSPSALLLGLRCPGSCRLAGGGPQVPPTWLPGLRETLLSMGTTITRMEHWHLVRANHRPPHTQWEDDTGHGCAEVTQRGHPSITWSSIVSLGVTMALTVP